MSRRQFPESEERLVVDQTTSNVIADPTATKVVSPATPTTGALRNIYASTSAPSDSTDGADGDIWIQYA
jgi:hypothetical protein